MEQFKRLHMLGDDILFSIHAGNNTIKHYHNSPSIVNRPGRRDITFPSGEMSRGKRVHRSRKVKEPKSKQKSSDDKTEMQYQTEESSQR